jgi:hypothetical protein
MDLESIRGCFTGNLSGTIAALEAVEVLSKTSLYA